MLQTILKVDAHLLVGAVRQHDDFGRLPDAIETPFTVIIFKGEA